MPVLERMWNAGCGHLSRKVAPLSPTSPRIALHRLRGPQWCPFCFLGQEAAKSVQGWPKRPKVAKSSQMQLRTAFGCSDRRCLPSGRQRIPGISLEPGTKVFRWERYVLYSFFVNFLRQNIREQILGAFLKPKGLMALFSSRLGGGWGG